MADRWEDWFQPGETLLWEGAPSAGLKSIPLNIFLTLFGVPFLGAGLFTSWTGLGYLFGFNGDWQIWNLGLGIVLSAFGVPFLVVGCGMMFGPWLYEILRPTRLRYALSNKNAYVANRMWGRKMDILPIRAQTHIETEEHRNGSMSIWFHFERYLDSDGDKQTRKKGFENLADGHDVYLRIRSIQDEIETNPS